MKTNSESRKQKAESRLPFVIRHSSFVIALAAVCLAAPLALRAHDEPQHEIDELTLRISEEGESAHLLLQRAIEYNVLRQTTEAITDLERALHFEPESTPILRELAKTYLATGKTNEASANITLAIKFAEAGPELGSALMVRCEIRRARKDYAKALEAANEAIEQHGESVEWYLTRNQLQQQLGLKKERIAGLDEGVKATGSGLLENEWLDALIDGGQSSVALARIEAELADARLKSTWLLRRAKVRLATNKKEAAKADLEAALKELNERFGKTTPDPLALMDRGQMQELLGNKDDARKDYEAARDKGVVDEWLHERIKALKPDDKKKPADPKKDAAKDKSKDKESEDKSGDDPKPDDDKKDDKPEDGK